MNYFLEKLSKTRIFTTAKIFRNALNSENTICLLNPRRFQNMLCKGALFGLFVVTITGCTPADPETKLINSLSYNVILPLHKSFAKDAQELTAASREFCAMPDATTYALVQNQWRKTMASWHGVKVIDFGPITIDNASWKIQFWPDKHNLIHRKIIGLLNSEEDITLDKIDKASVVVQGLSALELLLFDAQDGQLALYNGADANPRRCTLLNSISEHTQQVAETLDNAWNPDKGNYIGAVNNPGPENNDFKDQADVLSALVEALINATEIIKRDQLGRPLGHKAKGDRTRPYLSEAWRSRTSTDSVKASLAAVKQLYSAGEEYGMDDFLLDKGQAALAKQIDQQFVNVEQQVADIPPLFDAVSNADQQKEVTALYEQVNVLLQLFGNNLPSAMGVNLGFNANDGD